MKTKILLSMILLAISGGLAAQDARVDTLLTLQKQLMDLNQRIYGEVKYEDPLEGKNFGIEFNPAYLLLGGAGKDLVLSGTYSMFNVDRKAEIAFPVFFKKSNENYDRLFTVDMVYRRFIGKHQNGFYLAGGTRLANLRTDKDHYSYYYDNNGNYHWDEWSTKRSTTKVGAYFGVGYRYFTKSGFYWGASVSGGRYFNGKNNFGRLGVDGTKYIVDVELLKFGITF